MAAPDRLLSGLIIYKIVPAALWLASQAAGRFSGSPVDALDGFIHFSTAAQVRETAAKHFAGVPDLFILAIDAEAIAGPDLRWEPSRGGDLFPHLYSDLPLDAVRWAKPLPLGGDGHHQFPDSLVLNS